MDRMLFLKSIDQKEREFASTVVALFDQFMALYSLIGSYDKTDVVNETDESTVSFAVNFEAEENANQLISIIESNHNQLMVYNRLFAIKPERIDKKRIKILIY